MCIVQQYQLAAGVLYRIYKLQRHRCAVSSKWKFRWFWRFALVSFSVVDPNWFQCGSGHSSFGPPGSGTGFVFPNADPDSAGFNQNEYRTDQCGSRSVSRSGSTTLVSLLTVNLYFFAFPAAIWVCAVCMVHLILQAFMPVAHPPSPSPPPGKNAVANASWAWACSS